jgi:tRNA-dihydrouridine synthase 4
LAGAMGNDREWLAISAPMVRYSKIPFRQLVKRYGVDMCYTPMIMADSFLASVHSRNQEFAVLSSQYEKKDVVQFASNEPEILLAAARLIAPYASAVDLNCGCPQRWAMQRGIGAALLHMVRKTANCLDIPVSVKIRLLENISDTIEVVRRAEAAGAGLITVHGRTAKQRPSDPVDYDAIKAVKEQCGIKVIANGDIFTYSDAFSVQSRTLVDGVMAARGLLVNPALFHNKDISRVSLAKEYLQLATDFGTNFHIAQHHVIEILTGKPVGLGSLPSHLHKQLTGLTSIPGIIDLLKPME